MGSGRSSVMSALAKAANKYRSNKQSSQSFIDTIAKRETKNEELYKTNIKTTESNHLKSFLSKFTRNIPKSIKDFKSTENALMDSTNSKKKSGGLAINATKSIEKH